MKRDIVVAEGFAGVFGKSRMAVEFGNGKGALASGRSGGDAAGEKLFKMVEKEDDTQYTTVGGVNVSRWDRTTCFPTASGRYSTTTLRRVCWTLKRTCSLAQATRW